MRWSTTPLILIFLSLSLSLTASDNPYFAKVYAAIQKNIEEGYYEQNLADIEEWVQENEFKALNCYQKGQIFHKVGVSCYLLDMEEEAIRYFRDSVLTYWQNCGEVPATERATTIYNIGICFQYLGDTQQAKKNLDKALFIFENDPDYPPYDLAKKFQGIGNFYLDNYDSFRAELYYDNALNIFRTIEGTETRRFDILNNLLIMSVDYKKYEKGKGYFEQALKLFRQFPESIDDYELSMLYQNAAVSHFELGELDAAMERSRSGLKLLDKSEAPLLYSNAIEKMAMIHGKQEKFETAIDGLQEVVRLRLDNLSNLESYQYLAYAYENICSIYQRQKKLELAEVFLGKAFKAIIIHGTYDENGTPLVGNSLFINDLDLIRLLSVKASLYRERYQQEGEKSMLENVLNLHFKIDTLLNQNLVSMQFQHSKLNFLELILEYYGAAIEDALSLYTLSGDPKYLKDAYYFSSKTKAIVLQNELKASDAFLSVASPEMIAKERELVQQMYAIQEQLTERGKDNDSILRQYIQAQRELEDFVLSMEQKEPEYYQNKYAFRKPPGISKIQDLLPKDLAVIEYFYQAGTIFSFWITSDRFFQIPIKNDELLRQSIASFVDQCRAFQPEFPHELGHVLYQKLLEEGLSQMGEEVDRLCIIPDGILHTLPFEALNSSETGKSRFLIEDYSPFYSYSIDLFLRKKDRAVSNTYLGFGTRYSSDLGEKLKSRRLLFGEEDLSQLILPHEEINRATALFSGESFLEQDASLENFYRHSADAKIIHLSLHGLVDFENPLRSSIVFDDHGEEFVLFASDLYSHKINADLVVLSACHSASGKIYNGEGVQGMSKAFVLSGAKNILSSLWSASEGSTLKIMTSFLQNVKDGASNELALHQAKLDYLRNARPSQRHPFFWANFILIGELNSANNTGFSIPKALLFSSAFILIGFLLFLFKRRFI